MRSGVGTTIGDPFHINVARVPNLVDRTLLVDDRVHRLEVREVVVLLCQGNCIDQPRRGNVAVDSTILKLDLVEERVPIWLTR